MRANWQSGLRKAVALGAMVGGSAWAQTVFPAGTLLEIPEGATFDYGCEGLSVAGTVTTSGVLNGGSLSIEDNGVLNGASGTVNVAGNWANRGAFNAGGGTVAFIDGCGGGAGATIDGATVFHNLALSSSNARTFVIAAGARITVNGTLTVQGRSGQPVTLAAASGQAAAIELGPNARVVSDHVRLEQVRIGAPPQAIASIPTLSEWGLLLLPLLLGAFGMRATERARQQTREAMPLL